MEYQTLPAVPVLVIGGGLAGMYAALAVRRAGQPVTVVSKGKVGNSGNSAVAMSVHRFAPEAPGLREDYRRRFTASAAGVADPEIGAFYVQNGARAVRAVKEELHAPLELRCLPEGGKDWPYLACCQPKLGIHLTRYLGALLRRDPGVELQEGETAFDLVKAPDGAVAGVLTEKGGAIFYRPAAAVVLAAGGAGRVYARTSNTLDITGDGYAMARRAGLPLRDMEFFQFYPYRIFRPQVADIFPDLFEHGAVFRNEKGERFMERYPMKELENRNVLARAMYGQGRVFLDLTDCDMAYLERECPRIFAMYRNFPGEPMELTPVAHFSMGGVPLRTDCATEMPGLFACGEVTGGLHGANRLAGSALTECALFGPIAGKSAAAFAAGASAPAADAAALSALLGELPEQGTEDLLPLRERLRRRMWEDASVVRSAAALPGLLAELGEMEEALRRARPEKLRSWLELRSLLCTSQAIVQSAMSRKESIGAHYIQ